MPAIYLKAGRSVEVDRPKVCLGDVLEVEGGDPELLSKIRRIPLVTFHHTDGKRECRAVISLMQVIAGIHARYPQAEMENIGEKDFIVIYKKEKDSGKILHRGKTLCVTLICFFGAAFSAMAFNNDVDTVKMFGQIYELITGQPSDGFTILELTYSSGLSIGILLFFHHFGRNRKNQDPTPLEVEMRLYENDIETAVIENHARNSGGKQS